LEAVLRGFEPNFHSEVDSARMRRLGLQPAGDDSDATLTRAFWSFLATTRVPFEQALFDWHGGEASRERAAKSPLAEAYASPAFAPVQAALAGRKPVDGARLDHPYVARE